MTLHLERDRHEKGPGKTFGTIFVAERKVVRQWPQGEAGRARAEPALHLLKKKKTAAKAESGQGAAKNDPTVPLKNRATPPLHIKLQTLRYVSLRRTHAEAEVSRPDGWSHAFALRRDGIHALRIVSRHRKRALRFASGSSCVIHAAP